MTWLEATAHASAARVRRMPGDAALPRRSMLLPRVEIGKFVLGRGAQAAARTASAIFVAQ
jgi:hypothetical protein